MADDQDRAQGPQAAACLQWIMDTARALATEVGAEPDAAAATFSALMALGTVSLGVGVALAQQDRAWALTVVRQLTALQEQTLARVDPAALPAARQRTAYLDIARRLIAQAPLPTEGDAHDA
jgi:hypothetical protein